MNKLFRMASAAAAAAGLLSNAGCIPFGCGGRAVESAHVVNGVITFDPLPVGLSEEYEIPFDDSVGEAETFTGASFTGPGAADFTVLTPFPVDIPKGGTVYLDIQFKPSASGMVAATLTLDTMMMGPSPVQITGVGE